MLAEQPGKAGFRLLYITPLRSLSRDLALAIREPIEAVGVVAAGGDPQRRRLWQSAKPPTPLPSTNPITTPERCLCFWSTPGRSLYSVIWTP